MADSVSYPALEAVEEALARTEGRNALFYFVHRGWVARRVDEWSFVKDDQWRRDITIDVNLAEIAFHAQRTTAAALESLAASGVFREAEWEWRCMKRAARKSSHGDIAAVDGGANEDVGSYRDALFGGDRDAFFDTYHREFLVPLVEVPKGTLFTTFDLRTESGRLKSLVSGKVCSLFLANAVAAAVEEERRRREEAGCPFADLPALFDRPALLSFLVEWFSNPEVPVYRDDATGETAPIHLGQAKCEERIGCVFRSWVSDLKREDDADRGLFGWGEVDLDGVTEDFDLFYRESRSFRYFVKVFAVKQLYCVSLSQDERPPAGDTIVLRCAYEGTMNLFRGRHRLEKMSSFLTFSTDLGYIDCYEEGDMTVFAPDGMQFVPNFKSVFRVHPGDSYERPTEYTDVCTKKRMASVFKGQWLCVTDSMRASRISAIKPHLVPAFALGSLSSSAAAIRVGKGAWDAGGDGKVSPSRRIPMLPDDEERMLELNLMLLPKLDRRVPGMAMLFMVSLALYFVAIMSGVNNLDDPSSPATSLVLGCVPVATFLLATWDNANAIRRDALILPMRLSQVCVLVDVVCVVGNAVAQGTTCFAWAGIIIVGMLFLLFSAWVLRKLRIIRSWKAQPNYNGTFTMPL